MSQFKNVTVERGPGQIGIMLQLLPGLLAGSCVRE